MQHGIRHRLNLFHNLIFLPYIIIKQPISRFCYFAHRSWVWVIDIHIWYNPKFDILSRILAWLEGEKLTIFVHIHSLFAFMANYVTAILLITYTSNILSYLDLKRRSTFTILSTYIKRMLLPSAKVNRENLYILQNPLSPIGQLIVHIQMLMNWDSMQLSYASTKESV